MPPIRRGKTSTATRTSPTPKPPSQTSKPPIDHDASFPLLLDSPISLSPAAAAQHNQTSVPFLRLSHELQTLIIFHLHAREAIFLSLTCRDLYHGVLSPNNRYLWYKIGGFSEGLPGLYTDWKTELAEQLNRQVVYAGASHDSGGEDDGNSKGKPGSAGSPVKGKGKGKQTATKLKQEIKTFVPERTLEYKKLLVDTMLGDTAAGCQWCLRRPLTKKWYSGWKIRICENCFWENVITKHTVRKLNINVSRLPVQTTRRMGGGLLQGLWKPHVRRLIHHTYGPGHTLESLLNEQQLQALQAREESHQALWAYRNRQRELIWSRIQEIYNQIHDGTIDHPEFRELQSRYLPPSSLKFEWFQPPIQPWAKGLKCQKVAKSHELLMRNGDPAASINSIGKQDKRKNWIDEMAWKRLTLFKYVFYNGAARWHYSDIPMHDMLKECKPLAAEWYLDLCREAGIWSKFERAAGRVAELQAEAQAQQQGEDEDRRFVCPLIDCEDLRPWVVVSPKPRWEGLEDYVKRHLVEAHWTRVSTGDVGWLGDTEWLKTYAGRDSAWEGLVGWQKWGTWLWQAKQAGTS